MKKIIALLLCLVFALSIVGCGQDKTKDEPEAASIGIIEEEGEKEPVMIEGFGTQDEFIDVINEFNSTTDPARKEELGKIIEEVLKSAEEAAAAAE